MDTDFLTVEDAADLLGFHPETIKRLCRKGELPGAKMGRQWRLSRSRLEAMLQGLSGPGPVAISSKLHCAVRSFEAMLRENAGDVRAGAGLKDAISLARSERVDISLDTGPNAFRGKREPAYLAAGRVRSPDDLPRKGMRVVYEDDLDDLCITAELGVKLFPLYQLVRELREAESSEHRRQLRGRMFSLLNELESRAD